jgi:hypothetical protein
MAIPNTVIGVGNVAGGWLAFWNFLKSLFFGLIFFIIGIFLVRIKNKYSKKVTGIIKKSSCSRIRESNRLVWYCEIEYDYEVDGNLYSGTKTNRGNKKFDKGDKITVSYNPLDPEEHDINVVSAFMIGVLFVMVGIIIPSVSSLVWMFTRSTKGAGTAFLGTQVISSVQPRLQANI